MTYASAMLAISTGKSWRNIATAPRRAAVIDSCASGGRIGSNNATLSSFSNRLAACLKNASPRRRGAVARYELANTLNSTSSALGAGISAGSSMTPTPPATRPLRESCAVEVVNAMEDFLGRDGINRRSTVQAHLSAHGVGAGA